MRRSRLAGTWLVVAAGFGLVMPGAAQGQAPDYRAGEVSDPPGDASIVYADSGGGGTGTRLLDLKRVSANYDAGTGVVNLFFEGDGLVNQTHSGFSLSAALSAPNPVTDTCDRVLREGDFVVTAYASTDTSGYDSSWVTMTNAAGVQVAQGYMDGHFEGRPHVAVNAPSLLRRNYRCISGVHGIRGVSGYTGNSRDDVANFCLAGCPPDGGPIPPLVIVPVVRVSGNTLTWNRVGTANSYVVATSNVAEGVPGRRTTYLVVTGTSYTPPAAPGTTRYYGVRVNAAGTAWSTPEVSITYPPGTQQPDGNTQSQGGTPGTLQQGGGTQGQGGSPGAQAPNATVNQGLIVGTPNRTTASRRLTAAKAKAVAKRALLARYGTSFSRRTKRSYKVTCTSRGSRATCRVQWRYGRSRYKGKLTITRTEQGDLWRTAIKRTSIRRA